MKTSTKKKLRPAFAAPTEPVSLPSDDCVSDDELEIRFSLTALGELALAHDRSGRGRRFRGFGPCGAVA